MLSKTPHAMRLSPQRGVKTEDFPSWGMLAANRVFHKLDEIGNNANIGIRFFTT